MRRPWNKKGSDQPRRRQGDAAQRVSQRESENSGRTLFKRNRTLVGSLSASVSSASELSGDLRSPRAHVHHLTAHRRRLSSILFGISIITGLLVWLLYEFTAGIHVSAVNSSTVIDQGRYQQAIDSYFGIHPIERLRFALNEEQLTTYVSQQVPEVATIVSNGAAGFATGQFDIEFREPIASWLIGSNQYYVDKDGVSFRQNYFEQPQVRIIDQSGIPQQAGTAVASSRFLNFVGRTVDIAKTNGLIIEQAIIPASSTRQIEVKIAGHAYPIKLSLDRPVGEQVEDMKNAIAYFDSKQVSPEYVDVRVSGKAFYK